MSLKGIRFKSNLKSSLKNLVEGEVVVSADTQEWGLCIQEASPDDGIAEEILWRKHDYQNQPTNVFRGSGAPTVTGSIGQYYIDSQNNKIYQNNSVWEEIEIPLLRSGFQNHFLPLSSTFSYSNTIKKDGSVLVRDLGPKVDESIVSKSEVDEQELLLYNRSNDMHDNPVTEDGQVVFKLAKVGLSVGITKPTIPGKLYWDETEEKLKAFRFVGHIRYHTDSPITFSDYVSRTPTNGYIDIIGDDTLYPRSGQDSVTKVEVLAYGRRTSWYYLCDGCSNMTEFVVSAPDESRVTNFEKAWYNCSSLTSFPMLDVSKGTHFNWAWFNCSKLTSFPELDVSNGVNFERAWNGCSSLTSFPMLDTSSGADFYNTWHNCSKLTSFPLLDVSNGINFAGAWWDCKKLGSFPELDVSSGTNFLYSWAGCNSLSSFPMLDVSNGTNFHGAWHSCYGLRSFPMLDVSSGTDFGWAWYLNYNLPSFPLLDVSKGENFEYAWRNCGTITSFPELDVSSGTRFEGAWHSCYQLETFPGLDMSSGIDFYMAWNSCNSLVSVGSIDTSSGTKFSSAWRNCGSLKCIGAVDTTSAVYTADMFRDTPELLRPNFKERGWIEQGYDWVSNVPEGEDCSNYPGPVDGHVRYYTNSPVTFNDGVTRSPINGYIDIISNSPIGLEYNANGIDSITKVEVLAHGDRTSWQKLCYGCRNMTEFVVSATDESKVVDFYVAWNSCSSLTSFPSIDTSSGTNFSYTWGSCTSLVEIDGLNFDSVQNYSGMFNGTSSLVTLKNCSFKNLNITSTSGLNSLFFNSTIYEFINVDFSSQTSVQYWYYASSLKRLKDVNLSGVSSYNAAANTNGLDQVEYWDGVDLSGISGSIEGAFNLYLKEFKNINLSGVTSAERAMAFCNNLTIVENVDLSSCTNFVGTWKNDYALTTFSNVDISSGTNFSSAWRYAPLPTCPLTYLTHPVGAITNSETCEGI